MFPMFDHVCWWSHSLWGICLNWSLTKSKHIFTIVSSHGEFAIGEMTKSPTSANLQYCPNISQHSTKWCPPVICWSINPNNYSHILHKPKLNLVMCVNFAIIWGPCRIVGETTDQTWTAHPLPPTCTICRSAIHPFRCCSACRLCCRRRCVWLWKVSDKPNRNGWKNQCHIVTWS